LHTDPEWRLGLEEEGIDAGRGGRVANGVVDLPGERRGGRRSDGRLEDAAVLRTARLRVLKRASLTSVAWTSVLRKTTLFTPWSPLSTRCRSAS
jgi:hypothetical protein